MILEGEIKDTKMSSFSSDFQTLIKLYFLCMYFLYELLMALRIFSETIVLTATVALVYV